jgi:hypothetical protein
MRFLEYDPVVHRVIHRDGGYSQVGYASKWLLYEWGTGGTALAIGVGPSYEKANLIGRLGNEGVGHWARELSQYGAVSWPHFDNVDGRCHFVGRLDCL